MSSQLHHMPKSPKSPETASRFAASPTHSSIRRCSSYDAGQISDEDSEDSEVESAIPNVRTFVRAEAPRTLSCASGFARRRGVSADLTVRSLVCCGGGVLKGAITLSYNHKSRKNKITQAVSIKIDCVGVESVKGHEAKLFFTVAQDILTSGIYLDDLSKTFLQEDHIQPGQCIIPFELQLPLDVGPGAFGCKDAELAYTLVATIVLVNSKRFPDGRSMQMARKVKLYPCLDPQKALVPSAAPIDATEEGRIRFGGKETLKVAARIHRPSWIAGQSAYVDVAITNDTSRNVCKIQLDLVRHVSFYKSAAALSAFQSVDQRVPERIITKTMATNILTANSDVADWQGVKAHARETTTCRLDVPTNELSVSAGRYFSAMYVIRVVVHTKGGQVELELPITIIHINSLDVIPSSVKAVSRMIAAYATPTSPQRAIRSKSLSSRRSPIPNLGASTNAIDTASGAKNQSQRLARANSERGASHSSRREGDPSYGDVLSSTKSGGIPSAELTNTKPGIQCDLRRALSLEYQAKFSKLDISAEQASWTHGAPLARRSLDRKKRDLHENLAHRLQRERNRNPSFFDVV